MSCPDAFKGRVHEGDSGDFLFGAPVFPPGKSGRCILHFSLSIFYSLLSSFFIHLSLSLLNPPQSIISRMLNRLSALLEWAVFIVLCSVLLTQSDPRVTDEYGRVRQYTRQIEFDYVRWMLGALGTKLEQGAAGLPGYIDREHGKQAVTEYLRVTQEITDGEAALQRIYADASVQDKDAASASLRAQLAESYSRQAELAPLAEAVLQGQITEVLSDQGLSTLGQPVPSVLYHSSPVPNALIVSRRDRVEQIANISVEPDLPIDQQEALETRVDKGLDVSSLVVPIGGVGVYPTMVMRTTSLSWLVDTIAHEWTHNYLNLRPLGILYDKTPELRTMNETTAAITGGEIGKLVLERFYPELVPPADGSAGNPWELVSFPADHPDPGSLPRPPFDFRSEMHTTRVTVDALLAAGRIDEAEAYMRERQQVFLRNGYLIRKLNQAYFAFYGAYADVPGGAAGEDPVGPAVRLLRERSPSLAAFVNRMSWMSSFEQLQQALNTG